MNQNLRQIFKNIKQQDIPADLEKRILKAIALEKSRQVARKLLFARAGLTVSFGVLTYTLFVFGRAFLESDFWNLAKLAFSDTGVIVAHLGEFSVSLLETLPVVEILAILVPVFALAMLASYYFKFTNNNHFNHIA